MKRILLFLVVALSCMFTAKAQSPKLVVWMTNGEKVMYELATLPKTTYTPTDLVISTTMVTVSYPLDKVSKYTYESIATGIDDVDSGFGLYQKGDDFIFSNLKKGEKVEVYSVDGKLVTTQTSAGHSSVVVSLNRLPKGVYVIKADATDYKVMKP